jgi:hypothetical protein
MVAQFCVKISLIPHIGRTTRYLGYTALACFVLLGCSYGLPPRPVSIEIASEQKVVQIEGSLSGINDDAKFSFFGHAGKHVSIKVSAPGSIRGSLVFPSGKVEGAPGGLVFEGHLPETGKYLISIKESPMGEGWEGVFTLCIVIER